MLPSNVVILEANAAPFMPHLQGARNPFVDIALGGVALNDASQGLAYQKWRARLHGGARVYIGSESTGYSDESLVIERPDTKSITLAFDNNMQPVISGVLANGSCWLYWYDTTQNRYLMDDYPTVRSSIVRSDDDRPSSSSIRDVVFSYLTTSNMLCVRYSRERFMTEHALTQLDEWQSLYQCGMDLTARFQFGVFWDPDRMDRC